MGKKKAKSATYHSINEKFAHAKLKKIDSLMDQLRAQVGKKGDGTNGGSKTLIGAAEGLSNEAYDGKVLTDAYNYFKNTTLPRFKTRVHNLDMQFNVIDAIAK